MVSSPAGEGGSQRERDEVTGAYVERGSVGATGVGGNMEGYYGPPPMPAPAVPVRTMTFQAPQAPKTVQIPIYDGHDQGQEQEKMNEKHEYRPV